MRAIWKGSISFSLVNIPIALYSATRSEQLKFRLLRAKDMSPVNYKRVAELDGEEVPWDQIVKGYEYEKGQFVILKDEDFKRVDLEATQTIDIIDFVKLEEIDPMYFDQPYFLGPEKGGSHSYVLLRDALRKSGKVGIAKVVIRTRQHLAAVKPYENSLVLELMHFSDELSKPDLKVPSDAKVGEKELKMALTLVETMTDKWEPEKYTDDYREALLKLIHEKIEHGGELPSSKGSTPRKATKVIDLVSVLQESLAHTKGKTSKRASGGADKVKKVKKAA